jgi:CheY-like chemotaxis protein
MGAPSPGMYFSDQGDEGSRAPAAPRPREGTTSATPAFSVLVVDDVEDTRYLYERYFEFIGARVRAVADGAAALAAVNTDPPDVIVLDLAMPKMTGWEVLQRLKSQPATRAIPVVVVSGQQEHTSAILTGADAYCEKPCLPERLRHEVETVLRRARAKR